MEGDFDRWNTIKKGIDQADIAPSVIPQEREVWMCALGRNIGFEQNGAGANYSRPVLIVKKFNNKMVWAVPLSTKQKSFDFYYNFADPTGADVAAILAQLRLVSTKRLSRVLYEMPSDDFAHVRARLSGFFKSKPRTGRGFSAPSETEGTL
jgi:mRNA interferase MazF